MAQVNVFNDIPADFPSAGNGISIHWHGLSMRGNEWYDGSGHIVQCPIQTGSNFTYYFQVSAYPHHAFGLSPHLHCMHIESSDNAFVHIVSPHNVYTGNLAKTMPFAMPCLSHSHNIVHRPVQTRVNLTCSF